VGDQPLDDTDDSTRHDVFFNRGVIGSQAYAREFGNREPDAEKSPVEGDEVAFARPVRSTRAIHRARGRRHGLRAALYEFHYQPVANAFAKAIEAGADVKIVYDAESDYKVENQATIKTARLETTTRSSRGP